MWGWERIIGWYDADNTEERDEIADGLEHPPQQLILEKAFYYLESAIDQHQISKSGVPDKKGNI